MQQTKHTVGGIAEMLRGTRHAGSSGMDRPADTDEMKLIPDVDSTIDDDETHATTGGAAAAGAVTGGVIGLTGGPIGAAIGAVGGAIVGVAAERMMHSDDDSERARAKRPPE